MIISQIYSLLIAHLVDRLGKRSLWGRIEYANETRRSRRTERGEARLKLEADDVQEATEQAARCTERINTEEKQRKGRQRDREETDRGATVDGLLTNRAIFSMRVASSCNL